MLRTSHPLVFGHACRNALADPCKLRCLETLKGKINKILAFYLPIIILFPIIILTIKLTENDFNQANNRIVSRKYKVRCQTTVI